MFPRQVGDSNRAWAAHSTAQASGLPVDNYAVNALICASSSSCRELELALQLVTEVGDAALRDVHSVTSLLKAFALHKPDAAASFFERACDAGLKPTAAVFNALIFAHADRGDLDGAISSFEASESAASRPALTAIDPSGHGRRAGAGSSGRVSPEPVDTTEPSHRSDDVGEGGIPASGADMGAMDPPGREGALCTSKEANLEGAGGEATRGVAHDAKTAQAETAAHDESVAVSTLLLACLRAGKPEAVFSLFNTLTERGFEPRRADVFAKLIRAAGEMGDVRRAREWFETAVLRGLAPDHRMLSALVMVYEAEVMAQERMAQEGKAPHADGERGRSAEFANPSHLDEAIAVCWKEYERAQLPHGGGGDAARSAPSAPGARGTKVATKLTIRRLLSGAVATKQARCAV